MRGKGVIRGTKITADDLETIAADLEKTLHIVKTTAERMRQSNQKISGGLKDFRRTSLLCLNKAITIKGKYDRKQVRDKIESI